MKNRLLAKTLLIGLLSLIILIALGLVSGKVSEREHYKDDAKRSIAQSWTAAQKLTGPILVVPYEYRYVKEVWDKNLEQYVSKTRVAKDKLYFFPDELIVDGQLATEMRYRGIYEVPVYKSDVDVAGHFTIPKNFAYENHVDITWQSAYIVVGVTDVRGIQGDLSFQWQQQQMSFQPGTMIKQFSEGVHVDIGDLYHGQDKRYEFAFSLGLRGMDVLEFSPVGKRSQILLASNWLHPSFVGQFLPDNRRVDESGFRAEWNTSHFASNIEDAFSQCQENCYKFDRVKLGVSLLQPVDVYKKTDRAIKYGILFVFLTFAVFFLFEVLKRLRIHPIQYGLVGLALALFYQLLIALSEHIAFGLAYFVSASACVGLLVFYVSYVLHSVVRSMGFGCVLAILYLVLFVIIRSQDNALLMGAGLLFVALAIFMFATRHVDWYSAGDWVGRQAKAPLAKANMPEEG